jgi:hypothetical protein
LENPTNSFLALFNKLHAKYCPVSYHIYSCRVHCASAGQQIQFTHFPMVILSQPNLNLNLTQLRLVASTYCFGPPHPIQLCVVFVVEGGFFRFLGFFFEEKELKPKICVLGVKNEKMKNTNVYSG